ncbi:MAG TPA: hypothetical protein VGQ93_10505, partial [Lysobacter sp.]|nr:hypothetical protein [Lysobacter sp.]
LGGLFHDSLQNLQEWMTRVMELSQQAQSKPTQPVQLPPPPEGIGGFLGLGSLFALFISGVFAVGLGQLALAGRSVGGALADGLAGAAKNLLPLLVLAILAFGLMMALSLVLAIVVVVLSLFAALLHPVLAAAVLLPLYMLFLLALYVVLFGVVYHLWRDVAGEAPAPVGGIHV